MSNQSRQINLLPHLANGRDLRKLILFHRVESPIGSDRYFIPANLFDALSEDVVAFQLKKQHPELAGDENKCREYARTIRGSKRRLFVLLVCFGRNTGWDEIIEGLQDNEIHDRVLPFHRGYCQQNEEEFSQRYVLCKMDHDETRCPMSSHEQCGLSLLCNWEEYDIQTLHREQWSVQAPRFFRERYGEIPHRDLPDHVIMPFIESEEVEGTRGGYGEVWSVRIHPAHQNMIRSDKHEAPRMAVKRLFKEVDSKHEDRFLRALSEKNHRHLMCLLATYTLQHRFHFIFPYAKANLRQFWNSTELPDFSQKFLIWVLEQLRGLADALNTIHIFKPGDVTGSYQPQMAQLDTTRYTSSRRDGLSNHLVDIPRDETYGRHGDIKPENILLVDESGQSNESDPNGILQIADFGLGRFHRIDSRSLQEPSHINGSATYSPPEIATGVKVSRAYDIWSLGCTFLEFVTWICKGKIGLDTLSKERLAEDVNGWVDDYYYTDNGGTRGIEGNAQVRVSVKTWIAKLRQSDRCSRCLSELLDVIESRMIVISVKSRISAEELREELGEILNRSDSQSYLLKKQ